MGRRRHFRTVHQQIKDISCPLCNHTVRDNYNLNLHLKSHGTSLTDLKPEVALTCRYCNLRFETVNERVEHMEIHRKETRTQGWARLKAHFSQKKRKMQGFELSEEGKKALICTLCNATLESEYFAGHLAAHTDSVMKTSEVFMQSVGKFLKTLNEAGEAISRSSGS